MTGATAPTPPHAPRAPRAPAPAAGRARDRLADLRTVLDEEEREIALRHRAALSARKLAADLAAGRTPMDDLPIDAEAAAAFPHRTGLALSGGGIRSATFCLGVLQALRDMRLLDEFDYVSTVSGGGYVGGWWSAWLSRDAHRPADGLLPGEERIEPSRESEYRDGRPDASISAGADPVHHLRLFSNHLTPRKGLLSADLWRAVTIITRNIFLTWLTLLPLALAGVVAGQLYFLTPRLSTDPVRDAFVTPRAAVYAGTERTKADSARAVVAWHAETRARVAERARTAAVPLVVVAIWLLGLTMAWQLNSGGDRLITGLGLVAASFVAVSAWRWFVGGRGASASDPYLWVWWVAGVGAAALLLVHVVGPVVEERTGDSAEHRESHRERWRNLIARRQATLFKWGLLVGAVLAVAGFGHELAWYLASPDGALAQWVKRSGGVLAAVVGLGSGVFTAVMGAPSGSGERKPAPGGKSQLVFAAAPVLFLLTVGVLLATFAQSMLAHDLSAGSAPADAPRRILWIAAGVLLAFAVYEARTDRDGAMVPRGGPTRRVLARRVRSAWLLAGALLFLAFSALPVTAAGGRGAGTALGIALAVVAACVAGVVASGWMTDPNLVALHTFYKARLVRAYLGASNHERAVRAREITEAVPSDDLRLEALDNCARGAPYHLVNTTLNLVGGHDLGTAQRHAAPFVLSRRYCGSARTGFRATDEYMQGGLTLGTAVATSGAAAAPNMGTKTPSAALAVLLAAFNVRLGLWAPTPNRSRWDSRQPRLWPFYLLRESLSQTNDLASYCYLTDGGHFDNTGVYSLVERGCRRIVVADCGADPQPCFSDVGDLIRRCRIDFGADIDLDVRPFVKNERGESEQHAVVGTVVYSEAHARALGWALPADPAASRQARTGVIVWIKPSLTARERAELRQYHLEHRVFPQQSTVDQWFDEAQFESYRMLGELSARAAFPDGKLADMAAYADGAEQWFADTVEASLRALEDLGVTIAERAKVPDVFRTLLRPTIRPLDADDLARPPFARRSRVEVQRAIEAVVADAAARVSGGRQPVTLEQLDFVIACGRARSSLWPPS